MVEHSITVVDYCTSTSYCTGANYVLYGTNSIVLV